jgi:hypothetical protein
MKELYVDSTLTVCFGKCNMQTKAASKGFFETASSFIRAIRVHIVSAIQFLRLVH